MPYDLEAVDQELILFCKTFSHSWDEFDPIEPPYSAFTVIVYLRCIHCTSQRHDAISVIGTLAARMYHYPVNYRDAPKAPKPDLRVRYLQGRQEFKSLKRRTRTPQLVSLSAVTNVTKPRLAGRVKA